MDRGTLQVRDYGVAESDMTEQLSTCGIYDLTK